MTAHIDQRKLFLASRIALIFTAMTFAFRASLQGVWGDQFHLDKEQLGWIFSPAFYGFTLAMIFGGPLCDVLGMKRLLGLAFIGHIAGAIIYLTATNATMLFVGTLCIGIGNGMVEAACNPLVVTLYPTNKTTMLNRFHVWFPGGIALGGLISYLLMDQLKLGWHVLIYVLFIPAIIYGVLFWKLEFPKTERVTSGVSTKDMFLSCLGPLFLVMLACMFLTAATELGTNQWLTALLQGAGVSGILVLVFINGLMAIGRSFAGPVVHRLNPNGMLILSSFFACIGLLLLSKASGYYAFGAAFVFAAGICFFWPTMLGFVSEYLPKTGALGLSLMGGAGMFSTSLILPLMGKWFDNFKATAIASGATPTDADAIAGSNTFMKVAIMPAVLIVVFVLIYLVRRKSYGVQKAAGVVH
ncbi:MAG: MFS transporter [Bacteroidota bacterium]|nr:MFS transporter [Bacteroidota bacterium]MDP4217817.1 MFS transporter [Bacteroidota bacterium]MDP4247385.1 MFS transporter [Bacteroidota bacterium]MDP4254051.1 MFS transporter [Bacteroidota bacterium]MDP4258161.1 MFS transporter [Bacteroidota bacterium]